MTTKLVSYPIINHNGEWRVKLPGLNKPLWEAVGRVDFDHSETKRGVSYYVLFGFLLHDPPVKCWFREPQEQVETEATEPVKHYSCDGCALDVAGAIECHDGFGAGYIRRNYTPAAKQPEPPAPIPKPTPEQLKAIGKVLDGDAPRKCKKGDCVWNDSPGWCIVQDRESDMGLCGKLRWHLKNAPPTPDDIRGRMFQGRADQCSDLAYWMEVNGQRDAGYVLRNIAASLVDGKKFGPESDHAAECEGLIKRLVAWPQNDYREFDAIMTEARRLYPEAK